jgi:signal transduction histidine kinase
MLPKHMRPLSKKLASIVGLDQVIYAPLIVNNQSFGILAVNGHGLSDDDIPAIKTFAAHASIALENTLLFDTERAAHQQMVELTNYLQLVREEERTYMAREIHDEFGQRLTALKMDISWLTHHLPTVDIAVVEKVDAMDNLVDESIQLVRQVASDLRPGLLDDLGLTAALEWQAQDFTSRSGIEHDLYFGDTDLPPVQDRDTVLFRVFQEALTNIARHSGATKITVNLISEHDFIQLKIHDNGIGIPSEALDGTKSLGLLGMRERVRALGGDVEIIGIPDQGTTVLVKIPN